MELNETRPFRFEVVEEREKEIVIEVSQKDYECDLASGIVEDELLKPGKHKFHRVSTEFLSKMSPSNIKVEFQMKLDLDILKHFEQQTASDEITALQLLLNEKLRAQMESELETVTVEKRLLKDKTFIAALANEIKKAA